MPHIRKSPVLIVLGVTAVVILALMSAPALRASYSSTQLATTLEQTPAAAPDGQCSQEVPGVSEVPGCKDCKDRPLCTCRYNGHPRVSCNPCCYSTPSGLICRD